MMIDTNKQYRAIMETEHGKMVLELFTKDVPKTVNNFVFLATQGYYDNTTFHRVLADFMAQGGDPTGSGSGGPGYGFANEITSHKHVVGSLSMANTGLPNSNGSQFFITFVATPWLDGKHSVFGQLIEGTDVLKQIRLRDPSKNPSYPGDKLLSVKIEVKG
jgi:cyclophilin family peptidyl-prolyl cis-trans isomerase